MAFSHNSKAKRPKFLFDLQIKELVNIPQSSGYCFTKWRLKDGTGTSGHKLALDGEHQSASNQSRGTTKHVHVQHHRAQWNYALEKPVIVKLRLDKNGRFQKKSLVLEVYFEFADGNSSFNPNSSPNVKMKKITSTNTNTTALMATGSNSYSQKITGKLLLGTVDIDITEYVKEDEIPITNRFLLKHSKVNSIINVSLQLRLVRGSYEDFNISKSFTNDQLAAFRPGINTILDNASELSSPTSTTNQTLPNYTFSNTNGNGTPAAKPNASGIGNSTSIKSPTSTNNRTSGVATKPGLSATISSSMTPLVESLYQKTFKLPWDPRPGEFTPRECVEDILQGGNGWAKNEKGINLIDLQALRLNEMEEDYYNPTFGKNTGNKASNWPPNPNDDGYSTMGKREYLEKKQNWSHMSRAQRAKLRTHEDDDDHENTANDEKSNDSNDVIEDNNPTDFLTDRIRENKSWSIATPTG
ncbi:YBL086C [Saccharomyces arboricola H-6]|uniref:YBL086C n=1 Tax=Saccharomyces arboricola (strain H-6 / AS 2.3317 / CBS 10644) TaxID=1160507 RepID=J8Q7M6_SACAR|nr:YBL086C [Saccharomyces arboricola H-6]